MADAPLKPMGKSLSPAELARLEHAFASDPTSSAYQPLAEAYLGLGRFMEAMVVCKKGVKANPTVLTPRLLLARVYSDQGKEKKALEELLGALAIAPDDKGLLRQIGALELKLGQADQGRGRLLKAHALDPADADTVAAMAQWNVEPPPPPKVEPPPAPVLAEPPPEDAAPRRRTRSSIRVEESPEKSEQELREEILQAARQSAAKAGRGRAFLVLMVGLVICAAGYAAFGRWRALNNASIKKDLVEATRYLKNDSYDSYKKASDAAARVLDKDPGSTAAQGYLAYAWAIRWGEHGGGDEARKQAEENIAEAKRSGEVSSYLYAAEALMKSYSGQGTEGIKELQDKVRAAGGKGALLNLTLGLLQTNSGDLEGARESLERAQALASDDPRVYAALGTLYRRRGEARLARVNYNFALQYHDQKAHPDAMLGKAALLLELDKPQYEESAKLLGSLLKSEPRPSPRQLALAQMTRALLISTLSRNLADFKADEQKRLSDATGTPMDRAAAAAEVNRAEEQAFLLDRNNPELHQLKGRRLLGDGQVDGAIAELRLAIKADASRAQYSVELARSLMQKPGGEKEAEDALRNALKTIKESPRLLAMLGDSLRKQGKPDEALAEYSRGVADPKVRNPDARLGMALVYIDQKDYPKAQEALEKASRESLGQSSRLAVIYAELGRVYDAKGDRPNADETFGKALTEDPEYAPAYIYYARFLSEDRRTTDKAKAVANEYLRRDPRGPFAGEAQSLTQVY